MSSYLVPGRPSEGQRQAVRSVASMMELADEEREDLGLQQQANREEDREWEATHGGTDEISSSTRRILDQWNENRGADAHDDFYCADLDDDQALLDDLPGGTESDDRERIKKAERSVAKLLRFGVVEHDDDDDDDDEGQSAPPVDDYRRWDDFHREDFPSVEPAPVQATPRPAAVEDAGDDGWDGGDRGEYEGPRRASEPPAFNPG